MTKTKFGKLAKHHSLKVVILAATTFQVACSFQTSQPVTVQACTTANECRSEIEAAKKKRAALAQQQKELENRSADVKSQMENIVQQLNAYQEEMTALDIEMANLKAQQVQLQNSIHENDQKIRERLASSQLSLETNSALRFIANSTSVTEMIERVQAINDLTQTDKETIQTLAEQMKSLHENEGKQKQREAEIKNLAAEADKLRESKKEELDKYLSEVQTKSGEQQNETNKIGLSQDKLNEIETARKQAEAIAKAEAEKARQAAKSNPSSKETANTQTKPNKPSTEANPVPTTPIPSNGTALQNERAAFKYFVSQGYTREAAAGIIGNFYVESGMDPTKKQYGGGPGRGLAQWGYDMDGGRFNQLIAWARSQNRSEWALATQLDWTAKEIRSYRMNSTLASTHDVIYATKYFCDVFERPNSYYAHMDQRYQHAKSVLSRN